MVTKIKTTKQSWWSWLWDIRAVRAATVLTPITAIFLFAAGQILSGNNPEPQQPIVQSVPTTTPCLFRFGTMNVRNADTVFDVDSELLSPDGCTLSVEDGTYENIGHFFKSDSNEEDAETRE